MQSINRDDRCLIGFFQSMQEAASVFHCYKKEKIGWISKTTGEGLKNPSNALLYALEVRRKRSTDTGLLLKRVREITVYN